MHTFYVFRKIFECDIRALALLRIGCATVLLADLIQRSYNLTAHYTDFGVFPRIALLTEHTNVWRISLHLINGTWEFQSLLFILAGISASALLIGYKTRVFTIFSWFLTISLLSRNPYILSGGDLIISLMLFIGIFLPWGARYSFDSIFNNYLGISKKVSNLATLAYICQISFIYLFSGLLKDGSAWRIDGTAIYYALNIYTYQTNIGTQLGQFLLQHPPLLKSLTFSVLIFEIITPFLICLSSFKEKIRIIVLLALICMHLTFGLFLGIWLFSFAVIVSLLGLIPTGTMDKISYFIREKKIEDILLKKIISSLPLRKSPMPEKNRARLSVYSKVFLSFFIIYILLWNLGTLPIFNFVDYRSPLRRIGYILRIDQNWGLFAPNPSEYDGWYVAPASLRNGTTVDMMNNGQPVTWEKPIQKIPLQNQIRWNRYLIYLIQDEKKDLYPYFGLYLCKKWNTSHPYDQQMQSFEFYFMKQQTLLSGHFSSPKKINSFQYDCEKQQANFI
jgi:hypothetical protein